MVPVPCCPGRVVLGSVRVGEGAEARGAWGTLRQEGLLSPAQETGPQARLTPQIDPAPPLLAWRFVGSLAGAPASWENLGSSR